MNLHDDAETKRLLESLPADPGRERLEGAFLRRERQYRAVQDRNAALISRLAVIAEALPDSPTKAARELQAERRDLLVERLGMPDDLTVSARRYAASLSAWLATTFAVIDQERHAHRQALAGTETAFREANYEVGQFAEGTASPAYDRAYSAFRELAGERQPHNERLDSLTRLELLIREFAGKAIPGKIVANRPTDANIRAFVESHRGVAA